MADEKKKYIYTPMKGTTLYTVPVPPMLIDPFIPAGCLGGLSAAPGIGKSWLALEASFAVATGRPFLGLYPVTTKTPVLFIGNDASEFDYGRCWKRLTQRFYESLGGEVYVDDPTELDEFGDFQKLGDLNPIEDCFRHIIESDFDLDSDDKVEAMIKAVDYAWGPYIEDKKEWTGVDDDGVDQYAPQTWHRKTGAGLVIMDTIGSLTSNDLLDNALMIRVYNRLRKFVKRTGATVLLLNHNPKGREKKNGQPSASSPESWLGAISQVGKLDFWLHLRPDKDVEYRVTVVFKKVRGIKPRLPVSYRMNVSNEDEASLVAEVPPPKKPKVTLVPNTPSDPTWGRVVDEIAQGQQTMASLREALCDPLAEEVLLPEAAEKKLRSLLPVMVAAGIVAKIGKGARNADIYGKPGDIAKEEPKEPEAA